MATLTFFGAARQVTGSCYLLDDGKYRVLLECGLFQGPPDVERLNERPFPFDPKTIHAVVLSHAHLDHSGLLPRLVRDGFRGPIYATPPTGDLLEIMLKDAAFLQERDAEWENQRRRRQGREAAEPLYTIADVERALAQCRCLPYGERFEVAGGFSARFRDAGHILGSAIVEIGIGSRRLVFSGDLGNSATPIMPEPERVEAADVLLLESTYGDRDHRPIDATLREFEEILEGAAADGGNVVIPAFAVGRTQELLYYLGELHEAGRLKQQRIFLDSPMAIAATEVHQRYESLLNGRIPGTWSHGGRHKVLPPLQYTRSPEESMAINRIAGGAIIIAGSGMCTGGRIRHHLKHNLWRREARIVIVGFQAQGTPGRELVDGAKRLHLLGEDLAVNASIHTLGGFSAHAGQSQLLAWADGFARRPRLYLVHGEPDKMTVLRAKLEERLRWTAEIPQANQTIEV
ncbi:beta-lactamase [Sulfurifustis variabilis]|uniref:Beta-lactamase n=1 Tax=Sulfurifustis variabilis TaxID=1675686 RepID=A0A1B4V9G5_9GAMM|nr:MBL fold metallo-hydrolase [Sulfurifustis variabilis]BAU50199.1 beta-lactamase [Sulfurifustis variabilis]